MKTKYDSGSLYIVATPIGNLADISQRMQEVLSSVDLLACEDTRHTGRLLTHMGIKADLTSYHRDNEQQKTAYLLNKLGDGLDIALVSDAGTPGVSDPGAILVRGARQQGIPVVPIPGPSALAAALSVSGLQESGFYFGGFPAAKKGERAKQFNALKAFNCPLIFYEAPHRIHATLKDCLRIFGDRQAQLFRELTKLHEEHLSGPLSMLIERTSGRVRGELVLIINGYTEPQEERPEALNELIIWYRDKGKTSLKDAVRLISRDLDIPRSKVYRQALAVWKDE
ncbi:MAG: 16S rRNA (cytidine(1402)-2'-O)-methyltransferase [Candidatus Electrothrix sp. GW3-4]|uniref:16S rRNA (cytidine(1402)-2'-O)-methyltransferase n=1 Tax=Candidatus Electrothrix sp. GW3-4 TaxID=3126740 RepID=UPI0030CCA2AE